MSTERLFPLFDDKLKLLITLQDEQICEIMHSIAAYLEADTDNIKISDSHAYAVYSLLIADYERYDKKCKVSRERQKAYREKKAQTEAKTEKPKEEKIEKETDSFGDDITEIVDYLNQRAGTRYKAKSKKTAEHIRARLREGFTVEDFKIVIDKMVRVWTGTEMEKFIRPETLFNSEKFEGYLNRTDKTDAEMAQEAAMHKKYDGLFNWAQRKEAENDTNGICEDDVDHIGELPDFSKF